MKTETKPVRGWNLIKDAFVARGVEYIFSVPGKSITPVQCAVEGTSIRIITARHEQAAAFMAEAYGRLTKKPGIILVTFGPGFTNTISGIVNARLSNSPVILIAGAHGVRSPERLGLQDMRQEPVIESIVKKSLVCGKAERIPEYIDMAFRYATGGRPGPVFLELPTDVLDAAVNVDELSAPRTIVSSRPVDPSQAREMMAIIGSSEKPIIMAGSGAYYSGAGRELVRFVEKTGIPAFTMKFARGLIPDTHPLCFEASMALRPGCAGMAITGSDCVVLLGHRMDMYTVCGMAFQKDAKIIQVDIAPEELGRNRSIDCAVFSDITALLHECNALIDKDRQGDTLKKRYSDWVRDLRENEKLMKETGGANAASNALPINPGRLAKEIDEFMDRDDDIVIADGGDTVGWMHTTRTCRAEWNVMDSGLYGCLGVGIPYANAAKLVNPKRRVLLFIGDGAMGFNFMEIETSIRKKLPIVVVVNNNNFWGMTSNSMKAKFKHHVPDTVEIGYVPYHASVEALGGMGILVERIEDIKPALKEAFESGKTACINVRTDHGIVGPGSIAIAFLDGDENDGA